MEKYNHSHTIKWEWQFIKMKERPHLYNKSVVEENNHNIGRE